MSDKVRMILDSRATSGFPLSIGTSLALESLFKPTQEPYDPNREIPKIPPLEHWDYHYFNLETLIRNIVSSIDRAVYNQVRLSIKDITLTLEEEIAFIMDLYMNEPHNGTVTPIFYWHDHGQLKKYEKKYLKLRPRNRSKVELEEIYTKVHKTIHKSLKPLKSNYRVFKGGFDKSSENRVLITTHYPVELTEQCSRDGIFKSIDLLESHTGVLKDRSDLWTKYFDAKRNNGLNILPLCIELLLFLGDNIEIKPHNKRFRDAILDAAKHHNFTPNTTRYKIRALLKRELNIDI